MKNKISIFFKSEPFKRAMRKALISGASLLMSIFLVGIVIWISGFSPIDTYYSMLKGAFRSTSSFATVLSEATPLLFTGLAFTIAFQVRIINVGIESQMIAGSLVGAVVGAYITSLPHVAHTAVTLLIAGICGMLIAGFICFLKVRFQTQEVIICIMLNSILQYLGSYLANGPLKAEGAYTAQTELIQESAQLTKLIPRSQLTTGYLIGIAIAIILAFVLSNTVLGYKIRIAGSNRLAGETYGIRATTLYYITFMASGFIAAVGGSVMTQGVLLRFTDGAIAGYGFQGIAVAALGAYSPLGVILSSFLYGVLRAGSYAVNRTTNIPYEFVDVIQVMVVIFVSAPQIILAIKNLVSLKKLPVPSKRRSGTV